MTITVDNTPPPYPLQQRVADLEPGQSLRADPELIRVLRTTASRVKAKYPGRQFRTSQAADGARIWRTA